MRDKAPKAKTRCAIYTRKSTEDGLDQEYNSLDAQRDACASYILSQRHEGWVLLPEHYDDGGFSGGTMERPGLKRLLADIASGKVDTIVIYKVDRLTRSLSDFAKIVEVLDEAGASFVSVTQAFNTTTSMGRLTLNMLLSFAQFEREVTGERIRDKIAASKRKGLWMGGPVPLGYEVQDRKLIINEAEANLVRHIFQRYVILRSVNALIDELEREGHRTKLQVRTSGPHKGGCPFRRGTLYHLLSNRIYIGMIVHKGDAFQGEHPAIVSQALWGEVQDKLAARGPGMIMKRDTPHRSMLAGLLFDGHERSMTPSHATKGAKRYRYYVTHDYSDDQPAWRVGAHDLEQIVARRIEALLLDRNRIGRAAANIDPRMMERTIAAAALVAHSGQILPNLKSLGVERIDLADDRLSITIRQQALLGWCGLPTGEDNRDRWSIDSAVKRIRQGRELRLLIPGEGKVDAPRPRDEKLVALLAEAHQARELVLGSPGKNFKAIATETGRCRTRLSRLFGLSHLAPDLVMDILEGRQPASLTPGKLLAMELAPDWAEQRKMLEAA
jgi:DNA invertase Pin-like site-specific DNA recombinase